MERATIVLGNTHEFGGFSVLFWPNAHQQWLLNHNLFRFWPHTCTQAGTDCPRIAHSAPGSRCVCICKWITPSTPRNHTQNICARVCMCVYVCVCLREVWVVDQQLQLKDVYTLHRVYLTASHPRCPTRLKDPLWSLSLSLNVHDWWMLWKWAVSHHMHTMRAPHLLWHHNIHLSTSTQTHTHPNAGNFPITSCAYLPLLWLVVHFMA